jgi:hypothetical protein
MRCICPNSNSTEERYRGEWARGADGRQHVAHCPYVTMQHCESLHCNYPHDGACECPCDPCRKCEARDVLRRMNAGSPVSPGRDGTPEGK